MTLSALRSWLQDLAACEASVPARVVLERLPQGEDDGPARAPAPAPDLPLTADQVAAALGRTGACVRGWCRDGKLPGAFKLNSVEWRIPRASLAAFLNQQARPKPPKPRPARSRSGEAPDLGSWRRELKP